MKKDVSNPNRKVRYTMMVLRDSLIELMKERSILRITIKDICELADVSRSTFYAHYNDQYDLLRQIENEALSHFEELLEKYDKSAEDIMPWLIEEFLRYVVDNSNSIQVLMSENGDLNFQKKIFSFSHKAKTLSSSKGKNKSNDKEQEYATIFAVHGSIGLIQQWLKYSMDIPLDDMVKMLVRLIQRSLS